MLELNQTVNVELYVRQMERHKTAILEKRSNRQYGVLLLHDKARPYIAKMTKEAIQTRGWEQLPHPAYSTDLAPTDFHLFPMLCAEFRLILMQN